MWKEFKQIRLGCTTDGMGEVLEYRNTSLNGKQAISNLNKVDNLPTM